MSLPKAVKKMIDFFPKVGYMGSFPGEVFVELRTCRPVMTCEGSDYPNHVNLRQTGSTMGISSCWEGS